MPVQERFRRLGRVGFDEDGIRVRQVQAEIMNPKNSVDHSGQAETLKRQGFQQFRSNCSVFDVKSLQAMPCKACSLPDHFNCGF